MTQFSYVAIEFYHFAAFIFVIENFVVAKKILHSLLNYVVT